MSVIAVLTQEHRLFDRLALRLRPAPELDERQARAQIEQALLVLIPALGSHDETEHAVFDRPEEEWPADARTVAALVQAQHESLSALRAEISAVLAQPETPVSRLLTLAAALGEKLRWHLQTEEMMLWPLLSRLPGRSLDRSIERQAERNLRALTSAVARLDAEERSHGAL